MLCTTKPGKFKEFQFKYPPTNLPPCPHPASRQPPTMATWTRIYKWVGEYWELPPTYYKRDWPKSINITFPRCTLKGSRFKVSRLSFSPNSRDGFLYPGRYEICLGRFDPHDCTPNNRDAMNRLCTHTTYHKGTLVYTHNVLIFQNSSTNRPSSVT